MLKKEKELTEVQPAILATGLPTFAGVIVGVSEESFRQFIQDFYALSTGMQEIRGNMATIAGLSHSSYTALMAIAHLQSNEGVNVNDVARYLKLKGSSVTIEMGRLVELGMVAKRADISDKRKVLLALTPKATQLLERVAPVWRQINGAVFEILDADEFESFRKVVSSVLEHVEPALAMARFLSEQSKRSA
jgi:MarR family transcriptional regulator, organic hydroperoxide resistance regulator